jgi:uncharacterized protein YerC
MPQVSKTKITPDLSIALESEFIDFLVKIASYNGMKNFISDFFTPTEKIMFIKRFGVALLLLRKYPGELIKSRLGVSNSVVTSVGSWLKYPTPETASLLKALDAKKSREKIYDKIEEVLDLLPPGKYINWHMAGVAKFQRKKIRQAREILR